MEAVQNNYFVAVQRRTQVAAPKPPTVVDFDLGLRDNESTTVFQGHSPWPPLTVSQCDRYRQTTRSIVLLAAAGPFFVTFLVHMEAQDHRDLLLVVALPVLLAAKGD